MTLRFNLSVFPKHLPTGQAAYPRTGWPLRALSWALVAFGACALVLAGACGNNRAPEPEKPAIEISPASPPPALPASVTETQVLVATHLCTPIPSEVYSMKGKMVASHLDFAKGYLPKRMKEFSKAPLECNQIVMLGDSLTESNNWQKTVPHGNNIYNRGIGGDTSEGALARLDEIVLSKPKAVFLLIGTNDLWVDMTPEATVSNILGIVADIKTRSPYTQVFVQTVFPTRLDSKLNTRVRAINRLLKMQDDTSDFTLLDTYALLVDSNGALKENYTYDGVHLTPEGNAVWSELVAATLTKNDLTGTPL